MIELPSFQAQSYSIGRLGYKIMSGFTFSELCCNQGSDHAGTGRTKKRETYGLLSFGYEVLIDGAVR